MKWERTKSLRAMSINHGHVASRGWWESLDSYGRLWVFQWWDWGWWPKPSIKHFGFRVWVHHFVLTKQRLHSEIRGIVSFIVFSSLLLPCHTEFLFAELFLISHAPTSPILWRNCRLSIPSLFVCAQQHDYIKVILAKLKSTWLNSTQLG